MKTARNSCYRGTVLLLLPVLAVSTARAQAMLVPRRANGPPRHATLDLATGAVTRQGGTAKAVAACWANSDTCGYFSLSGNCGGVDQWMDFAVKGCQLTGVISGFTFGYASNALDTTQGGSGAALSRSFQEGATGFGSFGHDVAGFSFTGLPASPAGFPCSGCGAYGWLIDADLSGGFAFALADGPFGYSFIF